MKKFLCLFIILLFSCTIIYSLPKPKKDVGCIIGKIEVNINKDCTYLKAGNYYYQIYVYLINKETGKKYEIEAHPRKGIYYKTNLPPGDYMISKCAFYYTNSDVRYSLDDIDLREYEIKIRVMSDDIISVRNIKVNFYILECSENTLRFRYNYDIIFEEENIEELKEFFNKEDNLNYYKDFIWKYEIK